MTAAQSPTPFRSRAAGGTVWLGMLVLILAYLVPGLTGHDPWKQDEAYSFGIIYNMIRSGDLVVPTLAADPFMEKPPAYYITAAGLARLLAGVLPAHDAARLASGLYVALALWFTGLMARSTWGQGQGRVGIILLISTAGLLLSGHLMITDNAQTAGVTMACYGLLGARRNPWAGLWLGTGAGLAFLSKGLLGPGLLGISAMLLPLWHDWRSRGYLQALAIAAVAALPWLLIWPTALYLRSPDLFRVWLWDNNFGRYLGFSELGPPTPDWFWFQNLPWLTFPVLPLALWTLWSTRGTALRHPGVRMVLTVSLVGWGLLFGSSTARDVYALPLLPLLAVVAVGALERLPPAFIAIGYWFSTGLFGLSSMVLWGFWLYGVGTGYPPQWSFVNDYLNLDFATRWHWAAFLGATALQVGWLWALWQWRPPRPAALLAWPLGLTLTWGLLAILHLPWIDQAKSYRGVFTALRAQLPAQVGCVADLNTMPLRECERGMLHYVAGITTEHVDSPAQTRCDYVITETILARQGRRIELGTGWQRIWQGSLAPVHRDLFSLFRRVPPAG
jgi:4-amino-4-deoxy-L-arabinose transferase-like glycosyltransferase